MSKFYRTTVLLVSLSIAGCSTPTQPLPPESTVVRQDATRAAPESPGTLTRVDPPQVTGAFRHGDFVITVRGVRLEPELLVSAEYDLDPESPWPLGWPVGMDFQTSNDGRLWEHLSDGTFFPINTGAVAVLKAASNGFSYSVPLGAMHDPEGPISFSVAVANETGSSYIRIFGRVERRHS